MALVVVAVLAACGGGGGNAAAGTYVHPEEGTITLSDGGSGTWEQEGNDEPFEFEWTQEGDTVTFLLDGKDQGKARIEEGNLVVPPDMISGDEDVTFERQ
jgi:ABC-type glycerol-3-phosphate transport system substrate-binding protein